MFSARVFAAIAVVAAGTAGYATYTVITIGFVQAIAGSGYQAMDELRYHPDYEKLRASQEKLAMEDSRRKRRFKNLAEASAVVSAAATLAALGKFFSDRASRRAALPKGERG
jgi:pantoate kinase